MRFDKYYVQKMRLFSSLHVRDAFIFLAPSPFFIHSRYHISCSIVGKRFLSDALFYAKRDFASFYLPSIGDNNQKIQRFSKNITLTAVRWWSFSKLVSFQNMGTFSVLISFSFFVFLFPFFPFFPSSASSLFQVAIAIASELVA